MDRTTPLGLYNFGVAYLDTARAAFSSNKRIAFNDPLEFLAAHGLELILKAELARNMDIKRIRKSFGHDLQKLRKRVSQEFSNEFNLDEEFENVLNYLSVGHYGPNWRNRYIETGYKQAVPVEKILDGLDRFTTTNRRWIISHFLKDEN